MKQIIDAPMIERMLTRITHEIAEKNKNFSETIVIGIKTRGAFLAQRLVMRIEELYEEVVPLEVLDISNYRDDVAHTGNATGIRANLSNKTVILVDDVLYTGRSVRAALDAVVEHGRPRRIELVSLIDRGHREYPIRPDFVGKNIPTAKQEMVIVKVKELDGEDSVSLATNTK